MDSFDDDIFSDDEEAKEELAPTKEQVVFLIDAQPNMLEEADVDDKDTRGCSWLQVACKAAAIVLREKVVQSERDEVAIILYNTRESKDSTGKNNVVLLQSLAQPTAERIIQLEQRMTQSRLEREYGSAKPDSAAVALRSALQFASTLLDKKNPRISHRVIVFTADERPTSEPQALKALTSEVESMASNMVALVLFPMVAADVGFDLAPFWKSKLVMAKNDGEREYEMQEQVGRVQDLRQSVRSKGYKKRPVASHMWRIGGGLAVAVKLYQLLQKADKGAHEWVHARDGQPLKVSTQILDSRTGAGVEPRTFFPNRKGPFTNARFPQVFVTKLEVDKLKGAEEKGLTLLGFKPLLALKDYHQLRSPTFMYPDEKELPGSSTAAIALHSAMVEKGAWALCSFTRNLRSEPKLVAVLPQIELLDGDIQVDPPGFNIIYLPWADDIRTPESDPSFAGDKVALKPPQISEAQLAAADALIEELHLSEEEFFSGNIPNPYLQRHYAVLEALATNDEPPAEEDIEDYAQLDLSNKSGVIQEFKDAVYGEGFTADIEPAKGKKRKAPAEFDPGLESQVQELDFQGRLERGQLEKMTNDQLKLYLRFHRLPLSGPKKDLVARVTIHLQGTRGA